MLDPSKFIPCPNRPNHWIEVRHIPEQVNERWAQHGARGKRRLVREVVPARDLPTGFEIAGRPGQTLEELVAELNETAD